MPTYISLIRFTQKGVETIREGAKRLDTAKQAFRDAGVRTETLRAFNEDEYRRIITSIG